jgi:hypothetical protein
MSISKTTANAPAWLLVRERLAELDALLTPESIDSLAVAKAFEKVASALLVATEVSGNSSIRFTAVVKSLDLKTPKSALQSFVAEPNATE